MATYFMFGSYSDKALGQISAARTGEATQVVEANGGKITAAYALLGQHDIVLITKFPGTDEAIKTSVELARLLGISFTTAPAISVEKFDRLVGV